MQILLNSKQMRLADSFTVVQQRISSIDLMDRAVRAFVKVFLKDGIHFDEQIAVFCGKGNNGGDGLGIARVLKDNGYKNIQVFIVNFSERQSDDFTLSLEQLEKSGYDITTINKPQDINVLKADIVIDAILGSGLHQPLAGYYADLVSILNRADARIFAVDTPTGFPSEGVITENYNGIKAFKTICFQRPKINFFFPESVLATVSFEVADIGLDEHYIQSQDTDFYLVDSEDIHKLIRPRKRFSHKGTYGHALIIAGNTNTMGAAILSAMGCLHAGAGLTTACIPDSGLPALNAILPEVMAFPRDAYTRIDDLFKYQAIAIGSGLGVTPENSKLLESLIKVGKSLIIDADALNMLGERPELIEQLPEYTILTPHVKEFDRLFGEHVNWWTRIRTAQEKAIAHKLIIVLKNQYTFIVAPDGKVYINTTGNPAMAQGGMGDVLTGIIAAFVAQQYSALEAVLLGCYIHGKTGDDLARERWVVNASRLAKGISKTLSQIARI